MKKSRLERIGEIYRGAIHFIGSSIILALTNYSRDRENFEMSQAGRRIGYGEITGDRGLYNKGYEQMIRLGGNQI